MKKLNVTIGCVVASFAIAFFALSSNEVKPSDLLSSNIEALAFGGNNEEYNDNKEREE